MLPRARVGDLRTRPLRGILPSAARPTSRVAAARNRPLRAAPDGKGRRVMKGGSFRSLPDEVRTTARAAYAPEVRFDDLGFRCARSIGAP